eukprot:6374255-Amphidinium_carterae.1
MAFSFPCRASIDVLAARTSLVAARLCLLCGTSLVVLVAQLAGAFDAAQNRAFAGLVGVRHSPIRAHGWAHTFRGQQKGSLPKSGIACGGQAVWLSSSFPWCFALSKTGLRGS